MKITQYICQNAWTIGFVEGDESVFVEDKPFEVHWVKNPYSDRWFADPFILDVTDSYIYVLVEEFYDPIFRGRISKLTINRKGYSIEKSECVLELPTHLSFPSIRRGGKKIFIIPENSESGQSVEYEYEPNTNKCEKSRVICEKPLTDAILTNLFGNELIFTTIFPSHDKLEVFSKNEDEEFFHKEDTVSFEEDIARNAGDWFEYKGDIYRPAQDCTKVYGGAIILQKVIKNEKGFTFENIKRIESTSAKYNIGCHTLNTYKGITVLDAKAKRHPVLFKLYRTIRPLLSILK